MMLKFIPLIHLIVFIDQSLLVFGLFKDTPDGQNTSPVIGILSMPIEYMGNRTSPSNFPSSYVKFIESAGGRVIPILVGKDEAYYSRMVNLTSGMLFTGGSIDLSQSIYTKSAYTIWKLSLKANNAGHYYPLWGICQGFEFFLYAVNKLGNWPLVTCKAENIAQPLTFLLKRKELKRTKIFESASDQIIKILTKERVTYNAHRWCLPVSSMKSKFGKPVGRFFKNLAKSSDKEGLEFISLIESIDYPIYGVQFHPEKPAFEPVITPDRSETPHSFNSILIGQYLANFFVNEARKSDHQFPEHDDHYRSQLIYNYCPKYVALNASATNEQIYYFN